MGEDELCAPAFSGDSHQALATASLLFASIFIDSGKIKIVCGCAAFDGGGHRYFHCRCRSCCGGSSFCSLKVSGHRKRRADNRTLRTQTSSLQVLHGVFFRVRCSQGACAFFVLVAVNNCRSGRRPCSRSRYAHR